ncbi:hypothetical protein G6048_32060, partial [Streptomyces sp. YC419]|nr:hypothetical protein [Streptomyces ureilyticus]
AKPVSPTPTEEPTKAAPSSDSAAGEPETGTSTPAAEPAANNAEGDDGMPVAVPVGIAASVLVLGGGAWWLRSRRNESA